MPTTSSILGLTGQDKAAAIFTALGEAGPGKDFQGVLSTILSRHASAGGGKGKISGLVKKPSQFVANDPYTLQQVSDPSYGRKIFGKRYAAAEQLFENPEKIAEAIRATKAATQFRGQSLLSKRRKGDVMLDPKGNFYLSESQQPGLAKQLYERLLKGRQHQDRSQTDQVTGDVASTSGANTYNIFYTGDDAEDGGGLDFLQQYKDQRLPSIKKIDVEGLLAKAFEAGTPTFYGDESYG